VELSSHFLISMPDLQESEFGSSLIYMLDHGEDGAFGVVVNHLAGMPLSEVFEQLEIEANDSGIRAREVLRGGPVEPGHGLVLHPQGHCFECTREFDGGVSLSSSRDVLEAVAVGEGPSDYLVILGHAGWAPGQLEMEIASNSWLSVEGPPDILFQTPLHDRRDAVSALLGFDLQYMVGEAGHA